MPQSAMGTVFEAVCQCVGEFWLHRLRSLNAVIVTAALFSSICIVTVLSVC